jgi:hypothetical protein
MRYARGVVAYLSPLADSRSVGDVWKGDHQALTTHERPLKGQTGRGYLPRTADAYGPSQRRTNPTQERTR